MNLSIGAQSDVGRVREGNEDSFLVDEPLFVVADGMGGHLAGDVASSTAVDVILNKSATASAEDPETLADLIRSANSAIWDKAHANPTLRGMGTTCTLVLLHENRAHIAHVGDSRAYLLRDGRLQQITEDHTLVARMVKEGRLQPEEAEHHPQRSIITRALGVDAEVEVDLDSLEVQPGDRLMLCSDGLSSMIDHDSIATALKEQAAPQDAADELIKRANDAGGEDNITVVVID
ncbi:MAG: Stp1/IreP family PP2C-type Ser/Thr phosphatase, partial [Actinomycetota bacterium]|nr:Stp1/IreP family PP2C-type Ser/Thr phosphatase [Actinomycetota bacterium]